jgi:hypothetical protein
MLKQLRHVILKVTSHPRAEALLVSALERLVAVLEEGIEALLAM